MTAPVHYCTSFDHKYVAKGLALYRSLERHSPPFVLWVLALSPEAGDMVARLRLDHVRVIALADLERAEPALLQAKRNRSVLEYYLTLYPFLPSFLFAAQPGVALVTLIDPDLWFVASPSPLFDELGSCSVQITLDRPHSRQPAVVEKYGRFNAGWVSFRRDADGLACLEEWKRQCLEWCYSRPADGKYSNEKYLDAWPGKYDVCITRHAGANVGDWDIHLQTVSSANGTILIDGEPLLFVHFSAIRRHSAVFYSTHRYSPRLPPLLRTQVYEPYLAEVRRAERDVAAVWPHRSESLSFGAGARRALSILRAMANRRLLTAR